MIPKGYRAAAVLAVLAGGLGAFLVLDRDRPSDVERRAREGELFAAWRREDVTSLAITTPAGTLRATRVRIDAGSSRWMLGSEPADDSAIDKLLATLEHARPLRKVDPTPALGLDAPRATIEVAMGSIPIALTVGAPASSPEGAAYARVGGEGPVVISKELAAELLRPFDDYRERRVLPFAAAEAERITIGRGPSAITLERAPAGGLRWRERGGLRVARDRGEKILLGLDDLRADRFYAERPTRPPADALAVVARGPAGEVELLVGGDCPDVPNDVLVEVVASHRIACVPKGAAAALAVRAEELLDRRLAWATFDEVVELRIEHGDAPLEVARKGAGFFMRSPEGRELSSDEADTIAALVAHLVKEEAGAPTPGDPPAEVAGRVRLTTVRGEENVQIARDGRFFRDADRAWLPPTPSLARLVDLGRAALRPLRLFPRELAAAPARRVAIACPELAQTVERDARGYRFVVPEGAAIDAAGALALGDALLGAKAEEVAARVDDRTFGLDGKCAVELTFDADGGAIGRRIRLGREAEGGGRYARVEGEEPVLVLPAALVRSILTPLVDREPLRVDPTAVDGVTLERGGKTRAIDPAKGDLAPDEQAALGALAALGGAAAPTSFTRPAALDAHPNRVTIRVRTRGDAAPTSVTLVACPRTDDATWDLFVAGAPAVFRIERARLAPILAVAP